MKAMVSHRNKAEEEEPTPIFDYMQEELSFPCVEEVLQVMEKLLSKGWYAWSINYSNDSEDELEEEV